MITTPVIWTELLENKINKKLFEIGNECQEQLMLSIEHELVKQINFSDIISKTKRGRK